MLRSRTTLLLSLLSLCMAFAAAWPGSGLVAVANAAAVGYGDFSYQYSGVITPTGEKPQSKLWYNDGRWWGSMFHKASGSYHIYTLNMATQVWSDTGVQLDNRAFTKADCLWDGTHLYVVSGGGGGATSADLPAVLFRFSYNPTTHTYVKDFGPLTIRPGGAETIVIDKDSTGKLWVTYTQAGKVWVNHSTTADNVWSQPYSPPMPAGISDATTVDPDDVSSLVAHDGKIGVLWSNQLKSAFYFAYHVDGAADSAWTGSLVWSAPSIADDHINLKSLQADNTGNVFAVVKTSTSPAQLWLLARKADGSWVKANISSDGGKTRPFLLIDTDNRKLYVFYSTTSGGTVYYKQSSLDTISFPAGDGTLFMSAVACGNVFCTDINDVTSTKQSVNGASNIVVLASDDTKKWYVHNMIDLPAPPTPHIVFSRQPGGASAGRPFTTQPVATVQDANGNTLTSYNGTISVAIKINTGVAGATLLGTKTVQAAAGVATFTNLAIDKAGIGYRLTAGASGLIGADSSAFNVAKNEQTITFGALPNRTYGDAPFSVSAQASSGLPVSFAAIGACSVSGATVTIVGAGTCSVTASQSGDANTNAAPNVTHTFTIAKANETITFDPVANHSYTDGPFKLNARASSGLPITFLASGACTVSGDTVTITSVGSCTVTARQPGDANYNAASDVVQTFRIDIIVFAPMVTRGP